MNLEGRIVFGEWIEADDDTEACAQAHELCDEPIPSVELWRNTNLALRSGVYGHRMRFVGVSSMSHALAGASLSYLPETCCNASTSAAAEYGLARS